MLIAHGLENQVSIDRYLYRQHYIKMLSSISNISLLLALFSVALDTNFLISCEISSYYKYEDIQIGLHVKNSL